MHLTSKYLTVLVVPAALACAAVQASPGEPTARAPGTINVRFSGGTIAEYIKAVQEAAGGANILLAPAETPRPTLPEMQLDGVTVSTALALAEGDYALDASTMLKVTVEAIGGSGEAGRPVYRVAVRQQQVMVWNVIDLFSEKLKPADVLTAVENALDLLVENNQTAQVRFHEPTGVLIASGSPRQVATIDTLLGKLRGHMVLAEIFGGAAQAQTDLGDGILHDVRGELSQIHRRIDELERHVATGSKR